MCANARKTDGDSNKRNLFYMFSEKLLPLCSWSVLMSSLSLHYELYYQNKKSVLLLGKILKEGHLKVNLHSPMLMFLV